MMLEKITSFCYVSYHIRKELKSTKNSEKYIHDVRKYNIDYFVRIEIDICVSLG